MKFNPKTHQTRCGAPWRDLKIKGQNIIAVEQSIELVCTVNSSGEVYLFDSQKRKTEFDLIPIKRDHNLPKGIASEWRYAAKNCHENVFLFDDTVTKTKNGWVVGVWNNYVEITKIFPDALKNIPWDSGYFKRIADSDEWEFVEIGKLKD